MADNDRNLINFDVSADEDLTDTGSYTDDGDSSSWEEFADYVRSGPIQPYLFEPMVGDTSPPRRRDYDTDETEEEEQEEWVPVIDPPR